MIRRPPRSTRTDTLFPYTTLFRSETSPGFHTPAGTIILETQPSKPTAPADPIQNPSEPPKQILMSNLAHNVITFIPISSSNTPHGPNNPNSQLVLAENNICNEITIRGLIDRKRNLLNSSP